MAISSRGTSLVQVLKRHVVQCAGSSIATNLESPFPLGPLDALVFSSVPIQNILIYRRPMTPPAPVDDLIPFERFKKALARLLDYYPHLTGRLDFGTVDNAPQIIKIGAGSVLFEACTDARLADLAIGGGRDEGDLDISTLPGSGSAFLPPFDKSLEGVCRDPILAIQHTRFPCGSVILGIKVHHIVCDANGFFRLTRDLAELYRGLRRAPLLRPELSDPPIIHSILRGGPRAVPPQEREQWLQQKVSGFLVKDRMNHHNDTVVSAADESSSSSSPVTGRVLRFRAADLVDLKQAATDPSGFGWISTFEAISAYLWQKVYLARIIYLKGLHNTTTKGAVTKLVTGFWASIDMRSPSRLGIPFSYFPNAVYAVYSSSVDPELLIEKPLWKVAKFIHSLVRSVDAQRMTETMRWVAVQPDKNQIEVDYVFGNGCFTVSQWSKFDMYRGLDFDVDRQSQPIGPALVSPPFTDISLVDGLAMIVSQPALLENRSETGGGRPFSPGVDVNLSVLDPLWPLLKEDDWFKGLLLT